MRTLVAVAALLLASCSAGVQPPAAGREPPLLRPPLTTPDPEGLRARRYPVRWDAAAYVDVRTVDLHYVASAEGCARLAEVRVTEDAGAVVVTLLFADVPMPAGTVCLDVGVNGRTRVPLPGPLEGRRLVDGASGETRRLRPY